MILIFYSFQWLRLLYTRSYQTHSFVFISQTNNRVLYIDQIFQETLTSILGYLIDRVVASAIAGQGVSGSIPGSACIGMPRSVVCIIALLK